MARHGALIAAALTAAALAASPSHARADELPRGRLGVVTGVRNATDGLATDFGLGFVFGFDAAWELVPRDRWGIGVHWAVLFTRFDLFGYGVDPASVTGSLNLVELDAGLRTRFAPLPGGDRSLFVTAGAAALRTNIRIGGDDDRSQVGAYVGMGLEMRIAGSLLGSFEIRHSFVHTPDTITAMFGFALGG
jgi:hypothetical protein